MNVKYIKYSSLIILTLALSGCISDFNQAVRKSAPELPKESAVQNLSDVQGSAAIKEYQLNESANAGDVIHIVTTVEVLDVIPAASTISTYDLIAEDAPAADGFKWVHVIGTVTNNSKKSQTINSYSLNLIDSNNNKYEPLTADTILYVEDGKAPVYISIQPTQTKEWETYFLVPVNSENLKLLANDLSYLPEEEVLIDLAI